ncbi:MAG: aminotransferase class I/II-fold pyridoxal phosphate-dependent enzyme, partial [Bdellovibrionales bacterium]|nr:aminotransferase class I/II-fold pyridoxal phosphate-dependent enzyme [Bdellovibrionales bacterium]
DCQRWAFTHSFSKSFALAGLRIGMLLGNKEMQKAATYTRASMSSCVSVPSQQIALMLLTSNSCLRWQRETIKSAKFYLSAMRDLLASWGVSIKSTGALYLWTKDYKYETSYYPEWWSKSVHVSSGSQFGNPDYQRISIGRFEHVSTLLSRSQRSTGYHANQRV